jgi:hypothetical protein
MARSGLAGARLSRGRAPGGGVLFGVAFSAACASSTSPASERAPRPGDIVTVVGTGSRASDPVTLDAAGDPAGVPIVEAALASPLDMAFDPTGALVIVDWGGSKIRRVREDGLVYPLLGSGVESDGCETTPAADDGCPALSERLNDPTDVSFDADGNLVVADWQSSKIKRLEAATGRVHDECGNGARDYYGDGGPCRSEGGIALVALDLPSGVVFDAWGNLFIADQSNAVVRRVTPAGVITTVAGSCPDGGFGCPGALGYSGDGGPATLAKLDNAFGQMVLPAGKITMDPAGNLVIADTFNSVIRRVAPGADGVLGDGDPNEEIIDTIAGVGVAGYSGDGGPALRAALNLPTDVAYAPDGTLYIADRGNDCVRRVDPVGTISTAAGTCGETGDGGDGGPATLAGLSQPFGVAVASDGSLYIADTYDNRIRRVLP